METVRCKELILGRDIGDVGVQHHGVDSFAEVTLPFKILSGLHLGNCKVQEGDYCMVIDWGMYMCNVMV